MTLHDVLRWITINDTVRNFVVAFANTFIAVEIGMLISSMSSSSSKPKASTTTFVSLAEAGKIFGCVAALCLYIGRVLGKKK